MGIIRHYATLIMFSVGLLFGLQAPNFIDQYENGIDAHLGEAKDVLAEYVMAADSIHAIKGDGFAGKDEANTGTPLETDYRSLRNAHNRLQRFEIEKGALEGPFLAKVVHLIFYADDAVLEYTITNYRSSVSLTKDAVFSGLMGGLVLCSIFEVIFSACVVTLKRVREYRARQIEKKLSE